MSVLTLESLAKRVAELEREVKLARGEAAGGLSISANQQGPLPGWLTAGQFGPGVMAKAALHIKNDANQPGSSPRLSVTDPTGQVRFEAGNLAALGPSPAQWGMRVIDAFNNPIMDGIGAVGVGKFLANDQATNAVSNTPPVAPTWGIVPGSGTSFTVPRAMNVLILLVTEGNTNTGASQNTRYRANLVGVGTVGAGFFPFNNQASQALVGTLPLAIPTGGTYTIQQEWQATGSPAASTFISFGSCQVIQLGV